MSELKVQAILKYPFGAAVQATVTKNGYFKNSYYGRIVGWTDAGRVKIKSWRGIKVHAQQNVRLSTDTIQP